MSKFLLLTTDVEEDGGSSTTVSTYYSHERSAQFVDFVIKRDLKVTLFITGEILNEKPQLIKPYIALPNNFQLETHGYNHKSVYSSTKERENNIIKGIQAYQSFFSKYPTVYRAPDCIIKKNEVNILMEKGVSASSSLCPGIFPGRYNNMHVPNHPFRIGDTGFIEMPVTVTNIFRLPFALSFIQLFGFKIYRLLIALDRPNIIVFNMHLHDIFPEDWVEKQQVNGFLARRVYRSASHKRNALLLLGYIIDFFSDLGYTSVLFDNFLSELKNINLPEFSAASIYS